MMFPMFCVARKSFIVAPANKLRKFYSLDGQKTSKTMNPLKIIHIKYQISMIYPIFPCNIVLVVSVLLLVAGLSCISYNGSNAGSRPDWETLHQEFISLQLVNQGQQSCLLGWLGWLTPPTPGQFHPQILHRTQSTIFLLFIILISLYLYITYLHETL